MTKARDLSKLLSTGNGKIAGANLDVSFENITDTGTEGTRVATGTSAQRGSTAGQLRFNTQTGLAEYYNGTEFKAIDTPPTITSIDVTNIETDLGGTQTFVISGSLFSGSATVKFKDNGGTEITPDTTTVNSSSQITVTKTRSSFSNANEPYDVIVTNPSGLSAILDDQINIDNSPVWSTSSGNIATVYEGETVNVSATATDSDNDTIVYSVQSGSLPAGTSLNSATGAITGTAPSVESDTTTSFTLRATANGQTADRNFNIIVKNDVANVAQPLGDSSCIAFYKLEGDCQDSVGSNHSTTMYAGTFTANMFDSTNQAIGSKSFNANYNSSAHIIDLPEVRNSYPMTLSCWISRDNDWNSGTSGAFLEARDSSSRRLTFCMNNSWVGDGQNVFGGHYGGGNHFTYAYPSSSYFNSKGLDNWFHIVWVISSYQTGAMYLQGSALTQTNRGGATGGGAGWTIGGNAGGGEQWLGRIDHVRVFNKALTANEVSTLYNLESIQVVTNG
jgi:hypothetical protein